MKIHVKDLVEQNNERRKQLTSENEAYYEQLLIYMRMQSNKSERATEELLLEMLDQLIEEQKEGKTAIQVFGKEPKVLADELVQQLPNESNKVTLLFVSEIICTFLGYFIVIKGMFTIFAGYQPTIYVWNSIIVAIGAVIIVGILLDYTVKGIRKGAFHHTSQRKQTTWEIAGLSMVAIIIIAALNFIPKIGYPIEIPRYLTLVLGVTLVILSWIARKYRAHIE